MTQTAVEQLVAFLDDPDPYGQEPAEVLGLQIRGAQERLDERREQIPVLDQRMRDLDIDTVKKWEDLVPVLFAHTTYKSYPDSLVSNGRWDKLLQWYGTLATTSTDNVDLSSVTDIDGWIEALWTAGHRAYSSSGTGGKCSFLPAVLADREIGGRIQSHWFYWPGEAPAANSLRWYQLSPRTGASRAIETWNATSDVLARSDAVMHLSDRPLLVSDVSRAVAMRRAMIDGTATPSQMSAFEAEATARTEEMSAAMEQMTREIIEHHDEPMAVVGHWSLHWSILETARKMGVPRAKFHPASLAYGSGGTKGTKLPADYREQVRGFFHGASYPMGYGMSELNGQFPRCPAGRYHQPPWIAVLVLDQTGEELLNVDEGEVRGRAAFFDFTVTGRWGGIVTGDRISVRFGQCDCGRSGPTVGDDVARYSELEGNDDKLSCAGTMEAYIRGAIEL
jgi:hypothetical protein